MWHTVATVVYRLMQQLLMHNLLRLSQKYWIRTGRSSAVLRGFLQSLSENVGTVPLPDDDRFRPDPFQHVIHETVCHSTLYSLMYSQCRI